MKFFMLSFVTALVSSSALSSGGPVMPLTIATIVAEDGMKIEISSDGDVNLTEPGKAPRLLRTLSRKTLDRFNEDQSALNIAGALKKSASESSAICADPRGLTFSARGHNGKLQVIGSVEGCHDFTPSDDSTQAISMRDFLKSVSLPIANTSVVGAR